MIKETPDTQVLPPSLLMQLPYYQFSIIAQLIYPYRVLYYESLNNIHLKL